MSSLDLPTWALWFLAAGGLSTAALAVVALAIKTGRGLKTLGAWIGGIVRHEVTEIIDAKLIPVKAELYPNGGSSLRDQVDLTNKLVAEHISESVRDRRKLHEQLDALERGATFDRENDADERRLDRVHRLDD